MGITKELNVRAVLFEEFKCAHVREDNRNHDEEYDIDLRYNKLFVTRGSSEIFRFDLSNKSYDLDDIKQLIFIFSQNGLIWNFEMYDEDGNLNPKFEIIEEKEVLKDQYGNIIYDADGKPVVQVVGVDIAIKLDENDTVKFSPTYDRGSKTNVEVVVQLDADQDPSSIQNNTTIIETLPSFSVLDSAYSKIISE